MPQTQRWSDADMPLLELKSESGAVFSCRIEGWLQTSVEKDEWQQIVSRVAQYAFTSRSATLITVSPARWSLGHSLPEPRCLRLGQGEYLVNRIDHCSPALLAEITESEDFKRGLLWISTVDDSDEQHLLATISETDIMSADPPGSSELLLLLDDARHIKWFHPSRDVKTLEDEVRDIVQNIGWSVSGLSGTAQ